MAALALAEGALLLLQAPSADAQPEVTFMFPEEGAFLTEPPPIIRMCFADPVNINDPDKGGDFKFSVQTPEDRGLGLRIVFRPDGLGVDVHPGLQEEPIDGVWTFEWRVTEPETLEPTSGTVQFTVGPEGEPLPEETPGDCTAAPEPTPASSAEEDNDGSDTSLVIAILVIAVTVGGILGLLAYRRLRPGGPAPPQPPTGGDI